jgi:HlyD family secretion protein
MADDTLGQAYERRRNARGLEPQVVPSRWTRRLLIAGAGLLIVVAMAASLWVYWALTYVGTIRAEVCGGVVFLSPDFDARLAALSVAEGQHVEAEQELARFDDSERKAELAAAEAGVMLRKNQHEVALSRVESAKAELALAKLRGTEEIRRAEANMKSSQARLERLRKGARPEDIEAAEARLESAKAVASLYRLQLTQTEKLSAKGIESALDVEIMKTQLATQSNLVREAELAVAKLQAGPRVEDVEEAIQEVNARKADLALALASKDDLRRLELELDSRNAQLRQAKAESDAAEANVRMRRATLDKTLLRSPVAGTVVRIYYSTGEVVRKGEPAIEVADDSKGRWVEGYVAEEDANDVRVGQKAHIEIGVDSGTYVETTVEQVGLSAAPGNSRYRSYSETGDYGRPSPIWLKLGLPKTDPPTRPGTSAYVLIRVR